MKSLKSLMFRMRRKGLILVFIFILQGVASGQEDEALRLYQQGVEAYQYGRYQKVLNCFEGSLKIYRSLNNLEGISAKLNYIGAVYDALSQDDKSLGYYEIKSQKCLSTLNLLRLF